MPLLLLLLLPLVSTSPPGLLQQPSGCLEPTPLLILSVVIWCYCYCQGLIVIVIVQVREETGGHYRNTLLGLLPHGRTRWKNFDLVKKKLCRNLTTRHTLCACDCDKCDTLCATQPTGNKDLMSATPLFLHFVFWPENFWLAKLDCSFKQLLQQLTHIFRQVFELKMVECICWTSPLLNTDNKGLLANSARCKYNLGNLSRNLWRALRKGLPVMIERNLDEIF